MHVDDGMWDGDAVLKAVGAVVCGGGGFRRFQVHDAKEGFIKRPWSSWRMASAADKGARVRLLGRVLRTERGVAAGSLTAAARCGLCGQCGVTAESLRLCGSSGGGGFFPLALFEQSR